MATTSEITDIIKAQIQKFEGRSESVDVGTVVEIGDGIARIHGLAACLASELLDFGNNVFGLAFNLEEDTVSAIILGDYTGIEEGGEVRTTGRIVETAVGQQLVGRVVDPLSRPLDGKGPIDTKEFRPVDVVAPGVMMRQNVDTPVQTGVKVIDAITPIGRGQRELIIGDRQTGKTAVAIDTIINQKGQNLICIYVAIGQKDSSVAKIVATLEEHGAMDHTIVVIAGASDPAPIQYLAPFAGCAMGEYFRDKGQDALVVYDDLTKHAWAYRQVSLLTRRPPGREAYPGDVFYLHSRLLERASKLSDKKGGGSLTALPIIETQAGDVSAYIPTNVISITDGQIFLETDLFHSGVRPAINVGISVSRVGGSAQVRSMRSTSGTLRLDLAQYRELAAFAGFGADLDKVTQAQLNRGQRLVEILKQGQYAPLRVGLQTASVFAGVQGFLDNLKVSAVRPFEAALHQALTDDKQELVGKLETASKFDAALSDELKAAILDEHDRHPPPHPQREEHAADHEGHEDGLRGEAPPRAGPHVRGAAVCRGDARGPGLGGHARRRQEAPSAPAARREEGARRRGDVGQGPLRRVQCERHQGR